MIGSPDYGRIVNFYTPLFFGSALKKDLFDFSFEIFVVISLCNCVVDDCVNGHDTGVERYDG